MGSDLSGGSCPWLDGKIDARLKNIENEIIALSTKELDTVQWFIDRRRGLSDLETKTGFQIGQKVTIKRGEVWLPGTVEGITPEQVEGTTDDGGHFLVFHANAKSFVPVIDIVNKSMMQITREILAAGKRMHYKEIWKKLKALGVTTEGKVPWKGLYGSLFRHPDFANCGQGFFTLKEHHVTSKTSGIGGRTQTTRPVLFGHSEDLPGDDSVHAKAVNR